MLGCNNIQYVLVVVSSVTDTLRCLNRCQRLTVCIYFCAKKWKCSLVYFYHATLWCESLLRRTVFDTKKLYALGHWIMVLFCQIFEIWVWVKTTFRMGFAPSQISRNSTKGRQMLLTMCIYH